LHIPDDTDACTGAPPERPAAGIVERNVRLMVTNSCADLDDGQYAGLTAFWHQQISALRFDACEPRSLSPHILHALGHHEAPAGGRERV
jgi:hypothetical protein